MLQSSSKRHLLFLF